MSEVISLASVTSDARLWSPIDALKDAASMYESGEARGKKLVILMLDDSDGSYQMRFVQAGMKSSELVALCETAKSLFLRDLCP